MAAVKKTVFARLEFGVMDESAIQVILDYARKASKKFGGCECFEVWQVEVDGEERDPDNPREALW